MTLSTVPTDQARLEAADWFARLKKRDVPAADLEAFRLWRKTPGHREAYDEVDLLWRRSESLKADPDIQAALAGALARTQPKPRRAGSSGPIIAFAALVGAVALGSAGYFAWAPRTYSTGVGEQRFVRLADGSTLKLDTDTRVQVRLSRERRDMRLEKGQALFDVAHDAARPFVVRADGTAVTALGTSFDVRRDSQGVRVTLVRGSVEVRHDGQGADGVWRLAPGQGIRTGAQVASPRPVDVASATSWTSGRLVFHATPLADAVAEVNRYNRVRVELDLGSMANDPISGAFDAGDTETFVSSVAELHDLDVSRPSKGVIRLSRAEGPSASQ